MEYAKGVKGEIDQRPKRFYKDVSVLRVENGWGIQLDARALRTPGNALLVLPSETLANVVADEWRGQIERIDLQAMFNTRLAYMAVDRTPTARDVIAAEAARYTETDLVCHLADRPAALRERQDADWGPVRDWAGQEVGVRLEPVVGIVAKVQPRESIEAMRNHALGLDDFRLSGLVHAVALLGSAVLGLAVERERLQAVEAYELSRLEEAFQNEQWGQDAEALRRTERARAEARALDLWFRALA